MGRENEAPLAATTKDDRLYTARELGDYLRVSRTTISRYLLEGCPHERLGPFLRFRRDDVMTWLRSRKTSLKPPRDRKRKK